MSCVFRAGWQWLFLAVLLQSAIEAVADEGIYTTRGVSSHWTPQEWTYTVRYADIRNYAGRPDEQTLNSLSVEWQKPELDALGNQLTIRGQMKVSAKGQKRTKPANWFQGVTVYLGMSPGAKPDWSKGMDQADTLHTTAVISPTGSFEARVDLRRSKYDRDKARSFQFGVALAKHSADDKLNQEVVWNSRTPAISSSVQMLAVPAAPALSRELALINRASGWPFANPNGVELIRAVNALQPLGKERALAVLEKYVSLTQDFDYFSDQEIVFWIIRLLFEPMKVGDRIPSPMIAVFLDDRELPEAMKWPLNPMAVHGDVPFMVGHRIGLGGVPEHPSSHIRWARLHGVIRDGPLVPTLNPLAAAEAILQSRRFKALEKYSREQGTREIRSQALAMVKGLVQPIDERHAVDDDQWRSRLKSAAEADLQWDTKREQFVTGRKQ